MKINYKEIGDFYQNIIQNIYNSIEEVTPCIFNKEKCNFTYSDEYLHAYGYLQRAGWRLADNEEMKSYYDSEYFFYFGLENLHDARFRIEHYLNDTTFKFPDCVYDYKKYDDIIVDYFSPIRIEDYDKKSYYYTYFYNLHYKVSQVDTIKMYAEWFERDFKELFELFNDDEYVFNCTKEELDTFLGKLESVQDNINSLILKGLNKKED